MVPSASAPSPIRRSQRPRQDCRPRGKGAVRSPAIATAKAEVSACEAGAVGRRSSVIGFAAARSSGPAAFDECFVAEGIAWGGRTGGRKQSSPPSLPSAHDLASRGRESLLP
jgi:hypothetical protein